MKLIDWIPSYEGMIKLALKISKYFLSFFFLCYLFLISSSFSYAADFKSDYQVDYDLNQSQENINSQVNFKIRIVNLKTEVYVSKFSISFPNTFSINNLKASDDNGYISPIVNTIGNKTKIDLAFSNPNIGKDSVNTFFLSFDQANLFKVNGKVWEVVLPVIENTQNETYKVTVNLPSSTNKKISISKPFPDSIIGSKITWNNPKTKTIYAVFGDSQSYQSELTYHLKNDQIYQVYTEVAFPPETETQKIFIQSIDPPPVSVRLDEDGNYLGKYLLKPLETKTINYKSIIQIYSKVREEAAPYFRSLITSQKNYLLTAKKYWQINNVDQLQSLYTPAQIYYFITSKLSYDYNKINSKNQRLGANEVLVNPDKAVCLEFADLFVGIAREKGIYSREIEGYGFSLDPKLQPISLSSDILHAWPEYFDTKTGNWVQVDPTWENTSGINYFNSFDLNHIVFVTHGKSSDYPLAAGMYKIENSRDVSIKPVDINPSESAEILIENIDFPITISDKKTYQGKFDVKNNGNTYVWNIPVNISAKNIIINKNSFIIPVLAPYETKLINFEYSAHDINKKVDGEFLVEIFGKTLLQQKISVIPSYYSLILYFIVFSLIISTLYLFYRSIFRRRK